MLDSMRGLAKSFVSKALMFFLVITFAVWGAGDVARGVGDNSVARVGDASITPNQYVAEQRAMQRALESMGVRDLDSQALGNQILRDLVQQKLVGQWQHDNGLTVGRDVLTAEIARSPEFKNGEGKFDAQIFSASLQGRGMNEKAYLQQLSQEVGGRLMLASASSEGIAPAPEAVALAAASGTQLRDTVLLTVAPSPARTADVTDDEAQEYYDANADDFAQPETRTLEYVQLDPVVVSDKAKEGGEQAIEEISMAIEDGLAAGSSMGEAVAEAGVAGQSKLLKDVTVAQFEGNNSALLRGVVEQGFVLGEGEVSTLQSTEDGQYFLVSVKQVREAAPKPFADVAAQVRSEVAKEKAREETQSRVQALRKDIADGKSWEEAAREAKASSRSVSGVARTATGKDGKVKEDARIPALLQQAIFERKVGELAGPLTRANGEQVLALVTAVRSVKPTGNATEQAETDAKAQLADGVGNAVFRELSRRYPVRVNEGVLQQLNGGADEQ